MGYYATLSKSTLALVVSVGLLLVPLNGWAGEKVLTPKYMPRGERMVIDGEERMTFNLAEYKKILLMEVKLQEYDKLFNPLRASNIIMLAEMSEMRDNNKRLAQTIFEQQDRINVLTDKWAKADLNWRKEKYKPKWGNYFAWSIAAGSIFFATGVMLSTQVD